MGISLFPHNQTAYDAARRMLQETGKAAVIHPTGTGKSFIAFQLCEEFFDKIVCWLSPSEYIFKTQVENLKKVTGGYAPENIKFYTYAKLMNLSEDELSQIMPDFIVLDEFHRCGAQMWGQGVHNLFAIYPGVHILGLSATAIRYLDNQRDMADELFDGNVASEMTLGEAIVRGILAPPKYVLSVFQYRKELEKYETRIRMLKNKVARANADKQLEELRRALEQADGLDEMFGQHMTDHCGKYIVFCAGHEHMQEMIDKAPEWFRKVDPNPHIYSAYSSDPETSKAFAQFKADDSGHLKLLFCIDMLNEGVHVEGVSGVILLRPTVSPIIYKQQIGRALSADSKRNAVIFDIVLNIENLCSIDAIEEEMQAAITYYRALGRGSEIVNERFHVVGEVRNCMELFERLNDSLTASWSAMFRFAKRYYEENGDLEVPKRYLTPEGYSLGSWLNTQRQVRAGKTPGNLTTEQIKKLDSIGMRWESVRDLSWERNYAQARQYYLTHGDLLVSVSDKRINGVALGRWIAQLRVYRKSGIKSAYLTPERIKLLDAIGMVWDVPDYLWEQNYQAALAYHRAHGNLNVPAEYVDDNGIRLGAWFSALRAGQKDKSKRAKLTAEQTARLDELGMDWEGRHNATWENAYTEACRYYREHGNLNVPMAYVTASGQRLGRWVRRQREAGPEKLSSSRRERLEAIGMVWTTEDPWQTKFGLVRRYYEEHGHLRIPPDYVSEGVWLRRWLTEQVARLNGRATQRARGVKKLTEEQRELLATVGIYPDAS